MKGTLFACETLANNLRIFINIDMFPRGCVRPVSYPILLQEEGARQQAGTGRPREAEPEVRVWEPGPGRERSPR